MQHQQWQTAIDESAYTVTGFVKESKIPYSTLRSWLRGESTPRQKNLEKMESAMKKVYGEKKIPWHPSYGYATPPPDREAEQSRHRPGTRLSPCSNSEANGIRG